MLGFGTFHIRLLTILSRSVRYSVDLSLYGALSEYMFGSRTLSYWPQLVRQPRGHPHEICRFSYLPVWRQ